MTRTGGSPATFQSTSLCSRLVSSRPRFHKLTQGGLQLPDMAAHDSPNLVGSGPRGPPSSCGRPPCLHRTAHASEWLHTASAHDLQATQRAACAMHQATILRNQQHHFPPGPGLFPTLAPAAELAAEQAAGFGARAAPAARAPSWTAAARRMCRPGCCRCHWAAAALRTCVASHAALLAIVRLPSHVCQAAPAPCLFSLCRSVARCWRGQTAQQR